MVASISVLMTTFNPGAALATLVGCWDGQSAHSDSVELVVVDAGSTDGSAARLHQLAARRPNVVVLDGDADPTSNRRRALLEASGRHVLVLDQAQRLTSRALELIDRQAQASGADVVLGRVCGAVGSGSYALPRDLGSLDPLQAAAALPGSLVAVTRRLLLDQDDPAAALEQPLSALPGVAVAAVADAAVAVADGETVPTTLPVEVLDVSARWLDGRLRLDAKLAFPERVDGEVSGWLVVAAAAGTSEVTVVADLRAHEGGDAEAPDSRTLHAELDPLTVVGGEALGDGVWELRLRIAGPTSETTVPVPPTELSAAVLQGRPLAAHSSATATRLDLGSTRASVVAAVEGSDASVVESPAGSLLTLRYPGVHVHGDAVVPARLRLDRFGLPARLVCADGAARLECYVTGLAGTSVITVSTGGSGPRATGLGLDIDEVGRMSVVPAPVAQPATPSESAPQHPVARPSVASPPPASSEPEPQAGAPGSTPPSAGPAVSSPVQRLRRRVPDTLEPVVERLSEVPALRRVYRALLRR